MAPLKEICLFLLDPWFFMFQSLTYLPPTVFRFLLAGNFHALISPSRLRSAWFGAFWSVAGPGVRETGEARVLPLLEGRVKHGKILSPHAENNTNSSVQDHGVKTSPRLRGTVLEVGPGTGMWVSVFTDTQLTTTAPITKIYGVEPNNDVHYELRRRVLAAGLSDRYEIVPRGIEELATSGEIAPGSLDCIVSVLCLCSIPEPEKTIRQLFELLKPGGTWFVYEHVRCESKMLRKSGNFMRWYQGMSLLFTFADARRQCLDGWLTLQMSRCISLCQHSLAIYH